MTPAVTIEERAPIRIAYLTHVGPHSKIGPTFERLYAWAAPRGLTGPHAVGVAVYLALGYYFHPYVIGVPVFGR